MRGSLAAVWREVGVEALGVGRVELVADRLRLDGRRGGELVSREVPLAAIETARMARAGHERIGQLPTLVLALAGRGETLLIGSLFGFGGLLELAETLMA
jgi:hypothetical protein